MISFFSSSSYDTSLVFEFYLKVFMISRERALSDQIKYSNIKNQDRPEILKQKFFFALKIFEMSDFVSKIQKT